MNPSVPYADPDLRNRESNSTSFYPLQVHQSPAHLNLTVYVAEQCEGVLEASINNAQFVQVQTPSTENMTIFEPTSVMQFHIYQTILPSLVTLCLKVIVNVYSICSFHVI